jgi:hypothetical protein
MQYRALRLLRAITCCLSIIIAYSWPFTETVKHAYAFNNVSQKTNGTSATRLVLVKLQGQQVERFASTSTGRSDGTRR